MSNPYFPSSLPRVEDSLWFSIDKPRDDENELALLEQKHQTWMIAIAQKDNNIVPIGKSSEHLEEEEEEDDEEECEEEEESDTNDDPDTDMMDERDSNDEASTY
ncbi:anaphase-promoting complex subunit 15B [Biomphalaria glabrata]|uniref:Anaphase-promoting complex subunit 15B-like n=2 Tax=Biomphalaria TaxID=6525 RepID=A0A2C9L7P0_BIOGL|nr:anaphase-promoting complex subunit 15B-like [Biomphalaria glabrata]KAI8733996.1 anaphase-promoting complex subunit 15B-like [Biomphalaria glabrata]KAI8761586.1 anaphase-promoting complex subunit 15B [Biomphalaria glabrata]KAK0050519.1 anaphase-promoting complex subunit 15B [Biomphalaria pfeifferi]